MKPSLAIFVLANINAAFLQLRDNWCRITQSAAYAATCHATQQTTIKWQFRTVRSRARAHWSCKALRAEAIAAGSSSGRLIYAMAVVVAIGGARGGADPSALGTRLESLTREVLPDSLAPTTDRAATAARRRVERSKQR